MRSTHFLLAALIIGVATLTACGGGGSGGPVAPPPVDPVDPVDPTDPVDPVDPPGPQRGSSAVPGINQIPIDRITVPNSRMKDMFAIVEQTHDGNRHVQKVRKVACNSYTIQCDDSESYHGKHRNEDGTVTTMTGSAPYSSITDDRPTKTTKTWLNSQADSMPNLKIFSISQAIGGGRIGQEDTLPSYLVVQGAGNQGVGQDYNVLNNPLETPSPTVDSRVKRAIAANKMLLVAGWDRDVNGNYIPHAQSRRCREPGVSKGCLWAQFDFPGIGSGTSLSGPQVASALASVLSVFPHTTHQNLAKFAKACARKTGNGIPMLLATYGGVGVADFTCMGSVTAALANLPTGGRTNVAVNGQTVSVSRNQIILSLSSGSTLLSLLRQEEKEDGFSYSFIPTGNGGVSAVLLQKKGDSFASASFGTKDDFFGFYDGHHRVLAAELAAGHENAFIRFSQERSSGDGTDIRGADGRAVGVTLRREFALSENTTLTTEGHADRFLGGSALISFGELDLPEGAWQYRLNLKAETKINEYSDLSFSASFLFPPSGEREDAAMANYSLRF